MSRSESLNLMFQAAEPELQNYIVELEAENLKLNKQIARLQATNMTEQHRIHSLESVLK